MPFMDNSRQVSYRQVLTLCLKILQADKQASKHDQKIGSLQGWLNIKIWANETDADSNYLHQMLYI